MRVRPSGAVDGLPSDRPRVDSVDTLSDHELLERCRGGDATSWSVLVRRYERLVITVGVRAGLSYADATDIAQATFIALLEASARIRQDERLASWLVTVARRKAWRARRRLEREVLRDELPEIGDDPHEAWVRAEIIHSTVGRLPSPCRELITALYLDPRAPSTYVDIAARLGRAVGSIGPLRARCLARLRTMIGEDAW